MDMDEQQVKPTNEIVKLVLNSSGSLMNHPVNPLQVEIQMPVHLQKVYLYEAETQTSSSELSDRLSKEAGDEARLTGSNKYGLLSLDEYQILRTGEEHCLKKYFSDDDLSLSNDDNDEAKDDDEEQEEGERPSAFDVERQLKQMSLGDRGDRPGSIDNVNNNASTVLCASHSDLSNTLLLDDTTHLSAALAQSTSSRISHSRYLPICQTNAEVDEDIDDDDDDDDNDEELDQLVASTFTPLTARDEHNAEQQHQFGFHSDQHKLSSIRSFVRQAIHACRENLTLVDQLLEHIPSSSYEHVLQRKVRRVNCIMNIPNPLKGLQYCPSTSVQTE